MSSRRTPLESSPLVSGPRQSTHRAMVTQKIRLETGPGPYLIEASGGNSVDRIRATCIQIEVRYLYGKMGEYERLEPFTVSAGAVVDYRGREWTREAPYPYPEADEVVVVRNSSAGLESVRCV